MKNEKKKKRIELVIRILVIALVLLAFWFSVPVAEEIDISSEERESVRCVLVTDLHSCYYGKGQRSLLRMIDKQEPDIVLLSGDIFDDKKNNENAREFLASVSQKYPCYYVTGNHEFWSGRVEEIKDDVRDMGITVLAGDCETIEINGRMIDICGVDDPTAMSENQFVNQLDSAYTGTEEDHYKILLSHRPERIDLYAKYDFDLVVSGHAHGGQIMIPFAKIGTYAPNQGVFAKYVSGVYPVENNVDGVMVVSRGLARESTPAPRYFNHPEIVVIDF